MKTSNKIISGLLVTLIFALNSLSCFSQTVLTANGPGSTYELINSVLAPGSTAVETPDQFDPAFGRHIAEVWDADLNQYVFEFYIHVSVPNEFQDESTGDTDRQRVEIKTYAPSPENLKGAIRETVEYKWKFKLPSGFQPSSNFTHIHQIKAVGGDESDPIFTLTCRKGSPNKLELNYYSDSNLSSIKLTSANLSLFENTWVEATERIYYDPVHGSYSISIKRVSDGITVMSYSNANMLTYRPDNTFTRPKWGIYRSLLSYADLRDEAVRFNSFSIYQVPVSVIENQKKSPDFKVLQNVTNGKLKVQFNSVVNKTVTLEIFNTKGQKLKEISVDNKNLSGLNETEIDVSDLLTGIYIIRLKSDSDSKSIKFSMN